jgi:hypothetical protein
MAVFLAVPLVALFFNVCVIREVRRISTGSPSSSGRSSASRSNNNRQPPYVPDGGGVGVDSASASGNGAGCGSAALLPPTGSSRRILRAHLRSARRLGSSVIGSRKAKRTRPSAGNWNSGGGSGGGGGGGGGSPYGSGPSSAATTVMLLSVSFYVIVTTLPATLVYVLESEFPEGDLTMTDRQIAVDPTWRRYLVYILSRKVVEEVCLSHYACNIVLYLVTGRHFRSALFELLHCGGGRVRRLQQNEYSTIAMARATFASTMF